MPFREVPAEVLQTENTELSTPTDTLKDLQGLKLPEDSEHSGDKEDVETPNQFGDDLSEQPEEMCEEVEENVDPELSESEDNNEEVSEEQAEKAESAENRTEEATNLEETNSLEQQDCDQDRVASLQPECSESESEETVEELKQTHPEESKQQLQDQSPEMASPNQLTPPETPEDQPEQTACDEAKVSAVTGNPSEQNELPQQTACSSEQPEPSDKMNESEVTEQLSPDSEAAPQNEETESNHVDQQPEDVGITDSRNPPEVVSNGEKRNDSVVFYVNGGGVDREKACRLAERLFKLENIQRSNVVKHLDKE